jgi:hypothetical protein
LSCNAVNFLRMANLRHEEFLLTLLHFASDTPLLQLWDTRPLMSHTAHARVKGTTIVMLVQQTSYNAFVRNNVLTVF